MFWLTQELLLQGIDLLMASNPDNPYLNISVQKEINYKLVANDKLHGNVCG